MTLAILLTLAYALLQLAYWRVWRGLPESPGPPADWQPEDRLTVVIPARDEAANILLCLRSIVDGDYPHHLLEVIVIDDFSSDATVALVAGFAQKFPLVTCLANLPPGGKKRALAYAVAQARGSLIVTTDADCLAPAGWLRHLAFAFASAESSGHRPSLIAAPVLFHPGKNALQHFQALDFAGIMGITAAGWQLGWHRLGNGANLAYRKAAFEAVGGYAGADGRASGDDVFLIHRIAQYDPGGILFLKNREAVVLTEAPATWRAFFQQRLRWGTKNAGLPDPGLKIVLGIVFLFCWSIVLVAGKWMWALWTGQPQAASWGCLLVAQLGVKAGCDFIFLREMCGFFRQKKWLRWFWPSFFLHLIYITGVGLASLVFRQYQWKGRKLR